MFCIFPFLADCKDNNIIRILKKLSSQNQHLFRTTACKSGCKDKRFIFDSPNLFLIFLVKNLNDLIIMCITKRFSKNPCSTNGRANIMLYFDPPPMILEKLAYFCFLHRTP